MEDNRNKQKLLVKLGTFCVVLVLATIWLTNLQNIWRDAASLSAVNNEDDWREIRDDLNSSLQEIKNTLENSVEVSTSSEPVSATSLDVSDGDRRAAEELLRETAEFAIPPAPSILPDRTNRQCPAWVNCMPTISGPGSSVGSCAIPPGCEGITELVY